jgi:hypothetical protein
MMDDQLTQIVGQLIPLPGHFEGSVTLEGVRPLANGYECRVRLQDGTLEETIISKEEGVALLDNLVETEIAKISVDGDKLRLLIESARIRLAYTHDRQFAVSLSAIRTLTAN